MPFRRKRSFRRRVLDAARSAPQRGRGLRAAGGQLDIAFARSLPARFVREWFLRLVLQPMMDFYSARRSTGRERLAGLRGPVILVANHASHMDTPVILAALPRRLRRRTAVAAAADYFYRYRLVALFVSIIFNTVPIDRRGGSLKGGSSHLDKLLDQGWNLLLYPEGTRSRSGGTGRLRRGAAVLACSHHLSVVPIRVTGTNAAMPPGRVWPKRLRGRWRSKRHPIEVTFGEPIRPEDEPNVLIERVQRFFDDGDGNVSAASPYRRLAARR